MSNPLPILASVKSDWKAISESPVLGKDVLELLSSSMYINPLSIYREYIQNAADSIEEAVAIGLLANSAEGRIDITIDAQERRIRIRDNGMGLRHLDFVKRLVALGASRKRGMKARGFRGVGRLAGLGYCQELIFRSRADGEREVSELRWDCRKLKAVLRDSQFSDQLGELISQIVRVRKGVDTTLPGRFFEVELVGLVRHGSDLLMSAAVVSRYLSEVAPVPFSPEFKFRRQIEGLLANHVSLGNVGIFVNDAASPIYRPHRDTFVVRKGVLDAFTELVPIELSSTNGQLSAVGWVFHHGYSGAISSEAAIGGLRVRCGNIQVGENDLLDELFQEPRFNGWAVGEIHIIDERILPNGRRDHFEQSVHFKDLLNQLAPTANDLSRQCRASSIQRNAIREFDRQKDTVNEMLAVMKQGAVSSEKMLILQNDVQRGIEALQKICETRIKDATQAKSLVHKTKRVKQRAEKIFSRKAQAAMLKRKVTREKAIYESLFGLIYECSPDQKAARELVDRLLKRLT
jgi:molecular chaperone HtpG